MSHIITGRMYAAFPGGPIERAALCALSLHMKHAAPSHPVCISLARMAGLTGYSERALRLALRSLESDGWITATSSKAGGAGKATGYRVNVEQLDQHADRSKATSNPASHAAFSPPDPAQKGGTGAQKRRHRSAKKAASHAAEQGFRTRGLTRERETRAKPAPKPGSLSIPPTLTEEWETAAATLRPDLTAEQVARSYSKFSTHPAALRCTSVQALRTAWLDWTTQEIATTKHANRPPRGRNNGAGNLRAWTQDHPDEATDPIDPATVIESTARTVPD